jgi:hypothetical protein
MQIIGAGMAGLLAGRLLSNKRHCPIILERQSCLPNNHHAVLRFKTPAVGDAVGIPFKQVTLIKDVVPWKNSVADALAYSRKNSGIYQSNRSISASRFISERRWVAPAGFIEQLADDLSINYNKTFEFARDDKTIPIISTIPMPVLMKALDYKDCDLTFSYQEGCVFRATIKDCDAYVSLVVPNPLFIFSRISITGDELIVECPRSSNDLEGASAATMCAATSLLGIKFEDIINITGPHPQHYNKINPTNDENRKQFIWWATDRHNIYSLGRFATWRPGLQTDDLIRDIQLIDSWITRRDRYAIAMHRS